MEVRGGGGGNRPTNIGDHFAATRAALQPFVLQSVSILNLLLLPKQPETVKQLVTLVGMGAARSMQLVTLVDMGVSLKHAAGYLGGHGGQLEACSWLPWWAWGSA